MKLKHSNFTEKSNGHLARQLFEKYVASANPKDTARREAVAGMLGWLKKNGY